VNKAAYVTAIAADIKRQRVALGLTVADVARGIEVSEAAVRNWESGNGVMSAYSLALLRRFFKQKWADSQETDPAAASSQVKSVSTEVAPA
jgi:transcriptional regulator with XRE-family HTH domain